MDITIVLAKISGVMCLLIGLSVMDKKTMGAIIDDMLNSKALFWFAGFIAALLGIILLALYHVWSAHWPVLLTILGWLALLKGIMIMLLPGPLSAAYKKLKIHDVVMVSGVLALIVGIILLYQGFIA